MRRRQKEQLQRVLMVMGIAIFLLVGLIGVAVFQKSRQRTSLEQDWVAARQADQTVQPEAAPDPFAGLEARAIDRVRASAIEGTGETIGGRVEAGALAARVDALRRPGVERLDWRAERVRSHTVYRVDLAFRFHGVEFGPRWFVQMDPDGTQPEGSAGVVPANGLAQHLHRTSLDDDLRYLNRAEEVLQALTEHRFGDGIRLGSALLIFFEGRPSETEREIIGWHVVPEDTDPAQDLVYHAFFQWREDGVTQDAWWEVNLTTRAFQAKDLQANDIMAGAAAVATSELIDIRPRTLDLSTDPGAESNPRVRALRYVLADDRLVEAVGALLGVRARDRALEYVGWDPSVTEERNVFDLACIFREGEEEVRVTWRVNAATGDVEPTSHIARTAQLALSLENPAAG